jgi:hypothetical protein
VVFDTRLSRKASRYFKAGEVEQRNILKELDARGATYFLGDDTSDSGDSVFQAYEKARAFLDANALFDPDPRARPSCPPRTSRAAPEPEPEKASRRRYGSAGQVERRHARRPHAARARRGGAPAPGAPLHGAKYLQRTGRDLTALLDLCALWHDTGKAASELAERLPTRSR